MLLDGSIFELKQILIVLMVLDIWKQLSKQQFIREYPIVYWKNATNSSVSKTGVFFFLNHQPHHLFLPQSGLKHPWVKNNDSGVHDEDSELIFRRTGGKAEKSMELLCFSPLDGRKYMGWTGLMSPCEHRSYYKPLYMYTQIHILTKTSMQTLCIYIL